MGIDGIDALKPGGSHITDLEGYIRKRQNKGKTAAQVRDDLMGEGFDRAAAHGLVMMYWQTTED